MTLLYDDLFKKWQLYGAGHGDIKTNIKFALQGKNIFEFNAQIYLFKVDGFSKTTAASF